jgi:hypothetical protein
MLCQPLQQYNEVIAQLANVAKCQLTVDNAYNDIVRSGEYSYRTFVEKIIADFNSSSSVKKHSPNANILLSLIKLRESYLLVYYIIVDTILLRWNLFYQQYFKHIKPYIRKS